jgi:organic radical activating enzyme
MDDKDPSPGGKLPLVEHFYSLQGEGYHTGKAAYFIRIGGCDVGCSWCDSRYSWNPDLHPLVDISEIAGYVRDSGADSVVITGGEPLMWDMKPLTSMLRKMGIKLFLETSGSHPLTGYWDWICLSPKKNSPPVGNICLSADELKVIIEDTADFGWAEQYRAEVNAGCKLFLQPEWSRFDTVTGDIVNYILKNTAWSISLQSHKYMRIP